MSEYFDSIKLTKWALLTPEANLLICMVQVPVHVPSSLYYRILFDKTAVDFMWPLIIQWLHKYHICIPISLNFTVISRKMPMPAQISQDVRIV
jgi:hypothetical protein